MLVFTDRSQKGGALAGDDRVWVALARQTGCMLVDTLDNFLDTLLIFQTLTPRPQRPTQKVVLFGNGGGTSVLATDYYSRLDLDVTPFDQHIIDALAELKLPPGTSITNPVDCPVGTLQQDDGRVAEKILDIIYSQGKPEALVMHLADDNVLGRRVQRLGLGVALADTLGFMNDRALLTVGVRRQNVKATNFDETTGAVTSAYDASAWTQPTRP